MTRDETNLQQSDVMDLLVSFVVDLPKRSYQEQSASIYFEWLFLQPIGNPQQKLMPAVIRIKTR
jgi:hypothetical protein